MSNKFKVGDRVKCINNTNMSAILQYGKIYTVRAVYGKTFQIHGVDGDFTDERFELATQQPNTPNGCKPFNYEEAVKDLSKVVTRIGYKVNELYKFKNGFIAGSIGHNPIGLCIWSEFGVFDTNSAQHDLDLFIKDETVVYVNVGESGTGVGYKFKDMAIRQGGGSYVSICAITISNGEVIKTETVHKY